ncbi:MAG: STAS domain-containing protein [Dehalococcoidia bacterium]
MDIVKLENNSCMVQLPAILTDADEGAIFAACAPESSEKGGYIVLDFTSLEKMNGLGASMLVKLHARSRARGQKLLAFNVSDHYRQVLRVADLDSAITVYDSPERALGEVGAPVGSPGAGDVVLAEPKDTNSWANPVSRLQVPPMPPEAINLNVKNRRVVGPVDGFGQLWQKTYQLRLEKPGTSPEDVISALKQNFPSFQPDFNSFYPGPSGIQPGEIVAIDSSTPGGPLSTGVMVLYADEQSFTFITPQGHPESGWVTFSAFENQGVITAQILGLARANDPIYEAGFRAAGSKVQVKIWSHVLTSLAGYLGVPANISVEQLLVDPRMQWSQSGNIWHNAQIRTLLYMPVRLAGKPMRDRRRKKAYAG